MHSTTGIGVAAPKPSENRNAVKTYGHFINGAWTPPGAELLDSVDPSNGRVWAHITRGLLDDADDAMQAADQAFRRGVWASARPDERADLLESVADTLKERWNDLVDVEVRDNGKRIAEVRGQFSSLHTWYRHFADEARNLATLPHANAVSGVTSRTDYVPYGVVVAITPWNSPLMILAWKLAPALAAGNTVVVKPSEFASISTLEFAKLATDAGLPAGVLNVVTGLGQEVGEALVRHPLTRKVTFTGSDNGGRKVAATAAASIVPTTLELGGKSPQIVFADADLDNAVNGILAGVFLSNGQTCVAGSRLIVEASARDAVVERLVNRASVLCLGDPMDPSTQIAPLANEPHFNKVRRPPSPAPNKTAQSVFWTGPGQRTCRAATL